MTKLSEARPPHFGLTESAAPSTPATGEFELYAATDGTLHTLNDAAVDTEIGGGVTASENAMTAPVTMTTANTFYDGPSLTLDGTYVLIGHVLPQGTLATQFTAKLWNGTTTTAEGATVVHGNTSANTITLVGYIVTSGSETWKISCASISASQTLRDTSPQNSAGDFAGKLVAIKIA